jgi:hypothetical protein
MSDILFCRGIQELGSFKGIALPRNVMGGINEKFQKKRLHYYFCIVFLILVDSIIQT